MAKSETGHLFFQEKMHPEFIYKTRTPRKLVFKNSLTVTSQKPDSDVLHLKMDKKPSYKILWSILNCTNVIVLNKIDVINNPLLICPRGLYRAPNQLSLNLCFHLWWMQHSKNMTYKNGNPWNFYNEDYLSN